MAKKSSWGIWAVFYPFFGLMLLVKHYFVLLIIFSLMGAIGWFAMENYRVYTQGRGEYTSYLPSVFQNDRKGDKTVLSYMIFEPSILLDDSSLSSKAVIAVPKVKAEKLSDDEAELISALVDDTKNKKDFSEDDIELISSFTVKTKEKTAPIKNIQNNRNNVKSYPQKSKTSSVSRPAKPSRSSVQEETRERFKTRGPLGTVKKKKSKWTLEK